MKKTLLLLTTSFLIACSAQSERAPQNPNETETVPPVVETSVAPDFNTAAMDGLLSDAVEAGKVIGVSALVYNEGHVVYENAFGLGDRERNVPLTKDSVFRIYSMTKPMTSAVIMDLVEEGKISLDDPVADYVPQIGEMKVATLGEGGAVSFEDQAVPMTVKDLLLHRGGIAYGLFGEANPIEAAYRDADIFNLDENLSAKMDKLAQLPLHSQPGTGWYYSFSIDVLGRIIEVVTGQNYGDVMHERLIDPLGMNETGFYVRPDQQSRFVSLYMMQDDGSYVVAEDGQKSTFLKNNAYQNPGGGLVSTLEDYAKFAELMLEGGTYNGVQILEPETVKTMMSNQMDPDDTFMMPWLGGETGAGFGYGGSVQTSVTPKQVEKSGRQVGQWGWSGLARTTFYVDPKNDAFGIMMMQYMGGENPPLHDSFKVLAVSQTQNITEQ
ncbi:serine hydrolase domain-containing protein [Litorimonas haliclonae]|uniref:serine hydrolase domain-containing protein n=1 Tax=Litorimonas haliclonae TaxID=2081977 RepID=UPI0039EEC215